MDILFSKKNVDFCLLSGMNVENIILSELRQRKTRMC